MTIVTFPKEVRTPPSDDDEADGYIFNVIRETVIITGVLMGFSFVVGVVVGALVF